MKRFQRWLNDMRHALFERGDLWTLGVVVILCLMPAFALKTAGWSIEMRTIVPTAVLSVVFGYIMARTRYDELFALIVTTLYGFLLILVVAGINEPTDLVQGVANVLLRSAVWVYDVVGGGINQDDTVFTLLVATLFWYMGYNATWHIFRMNRVWRVLLPPATVLVVNIAIYRGRESLDAFLFVFVLMALILIVRATLEDKEWYWYTQGMRVPRVVRPQFLRAGVAIGLVCLALAWVVPRTELAERLQTFQNFMQSDPVRQLSEFLSRIFTPLDAEGPATADYFGGSSLNLSGAIKLGDFPVLYVQAPPDRRYYWRSRVFERYDFGQWSPSATWRITDNVPPIDLILSEAIVGQARQTVAQTFTIVTNSTSLIYAAAQPSQISVNGRIDVTRVDESLGELSPMNVSVIRPLRVLEVGASYTAVSLVSNATPDQLRAAGTDYPEWVRNPNLFVGSFLSERVQKLARDIVTNANATTPYDQAKAIETWLRQNIRYNENIPEPPRGVDPVEWFIFGRGEGYCTYYATAMATMLRSLGVPARLAAGFSQGEWNDALGQYVVKENDAHTWVEVYFPNYGWIEFEPTSSEELPSSGETPPPPPPAEEVPPSPTPTATPTETPTPTPTQAQRQEQDPPPPPSLPTLTPTPTPTSTPVIVPTIQPPVQPPPPPPSNDFLSFLLSAIGAALFIFVVVLLLVFALLFLWWWWEWRGMGGLSPIARAYARLERYLRLVGLPVRESRTPEERRVDIVRELPQAERPITYIIRTYIRERFGRPQTGNALDGQAADQAWQDARTSLLGRWLSRFNPFKRG
jgi:transglutaminase-like putative cysteine protease